MAEDTMKKTEQESGKPEVINDPAEQLRRLCRGTFSLTTPIRSGGKDLDEVKYDLCALTGEEILDALDTGGANNMFAITNRQAMNLFATSVANCTELIGDDGSTRHLFPEEVKKAMSAVDTIRAVQIGKLFYNASSRAGKAAKK